MSGPLKELELYAWVGEDEHGSSQIGLKQAVVPAGTIAMVAIDRQKLDRPFIWKQLQAIADEYGKSRHLVRFVFCEVVASIEPREGDDA